MAILAGNTIILQTYHHEKLGVIHLHSYSYLVLAFAAIGVYIFWSIRGRQGIVQLNTHELQNLLQIQTESIEVIDVRESFEFCRGHIPGAKNVPLSRLTDGMKNISSKKKMVFVCHSGARSMIAAKRARKARRESASQERS